jgi:hypothetical protein
MPLIGWGMLSAAAYPVVLFGDVRLPAILPHSDSLHALLWNAHFYLAFAFFALIPDACCRGALPCAHPTRRRIRRDGGRLDTRRGRAR